MFECQEDLELEVKFKPEARPISCKSRPVPLGILEDLNDVYEDGIRKMCGSPLASMPVEPLWFQCEKQSHSEQSKARIRVHRDYSAAANSKPETYRQPIPLPEHIMRNL